MISARGTQTRGKPSSWTIVLTLSRSMSSGQLGGKLSRSRSNMRRKAGLAANCES